MCWTAMMRVGGDRRCKMATAALFAEGAVRLAALVKIDIGENMSPLFFFVAGIEEIKEKKENNSHNTSM